MQLSRAAQRDDRPLTIRFPDDDLAIIDRAASQRGRSRTDFVREAAVRAAEEVLINNMMIRMSSAGFEAFVSALDARATPVPELIELFERPVP